MTRGIAYATSLIVKTSHWQVRKGNVVLEGLQEEFCQLLVRASAQPNSGVTPGRAHKAVHDALQVYSCRLYAQIKYHVELQFTEVLIIYSTELPSSSLYQSADKQTIACKANHRLLVAKVISATATGVP